MREHITKSLACQMPLSNYRKDGSHFINLITMVPIFLDGIDKPCVYFVGLQAKLNVDKLYGTYNAPDLRTLNDVSSSSEGSFNQRDSINITSQSSYDASQSDLITRQILRAPFSMSDIVGQIPDSMILVSTRGLIFHVYHPQSPIISPLQLQDGDSLADLFHPGDSIMLQREFRGLQLGVPLFRRCRIQLPDGSSKWVEITARRYQLPIVKKTACTIVSIRDSIRYSVSKNFFLNAARHNSTVLKVNSNGDILKVLQNGGSKGFALGVSILDLVDDSYRQVTLEAISGVVGGIDDGITRIINVALRYESSYLHAIHITQSGFNVSYLSIFNGPAPLVNNITDNCDIFSRMFDVYPADIADEIADLKSDNQYLRTQLNRRNSSK